MKRQDIKIERIKSSKYSKISELRNQLDSLSLIMDYYSVHGCEFILS